MNYFLCISFQELHVDTMNRGSKLRKTTYARFIHVPTCIELYVLTLTFQDILRDEPDIYTHTHIYDCIY